MIIIHNHFSSSHAAPSLILTLLKDMVVICGRCKRDVRAGDYDTHECNTLPTKAEVKMNKYCYVLEEQ